MESIPLPRFRLTDLYASHDDPKLDADLDLFEGLAREFAETFKGKLGEDLGGSLVRLAALSEVESKLYLYLHLLLACDAENQEIQRTLGKVRERSARAHAEYLTFFDHELSRIPQDRYESLVRSDATVAKHRSKLDHLRLQAKHLLAEDVERALRIRSPFTVSEWSEYVSEVETKITFPFTDPDNAEKTSLTLSEMLEVMNHHDSAEIRAAALRVLNDGLAATMAPVMARALNVVSGVSAVENAERGYPHPMSERNIDNKVSDEVVEALHAAVRETGAEAARRYYRLLSAHIGRKPLRWSDRNAHPHRTSDRYSWDEGLAIVLDSFRSFSPTLEGLVRTMLDRGWVDAPHYHGKTGGAFNYSVILPAPLGVRSYTLLNYLGSAKDVMTVAHEFGHGVHGMLAGEAQGVLLFDAPTAYAETASIFAEMVTFEYLLGRAKSDQERIGLLMNKTSDFLNTVVRQISFSLFEQRLHDRRKTSKLTVEELNATWMEVTRELYGPDGDTFVYEHMESLWSYVGHFLRPFYVYGYAFGELLTQGLVAARGALGDRFEPLYLDLLRAGGTKDAVELLKPFGLDATDPGFWRRGIEGGPLSWLERAEALSRANGITVPD